MLVARHHAAMCELVHTRPERVLPCPPRMWRLERIREAGVGAMARLSSGGSTGLEEQLRIMESAISEIRDEMWRRAACL